MIKELSAYLPYGLKCEITTTTDNILIEELTGFEYTTDWYALFRGVKQGTNGVGMFGTCSLLFDRVKPILRPLNDITKEIEHNGEKVEGWELISLSYKDAERTVNHLKNGNWNRLSYWKVERLFQHHFDVFGLIEKGKAIAK